MLLLCLIENFLSNNTLILIPCDIDELKKVARLQMY